MFVLSLSCKYRFSIVRWASKLASYAIPTCQKKKTPKNLGYPQIAINAYVQLCQPISLLSSSYILYPSHIHAQKKFDLPAPIPSPFLPIISSLDEVNPQKPSTGHSPSYLSSHQPHPHKLKDQQYDTRSPSPSSIYSSAVGYAPR